MPFKYCRHDWSQSVRDIHMYCRLKWIDKYMYRSFWLVMQPYTKYRAKCSKPIHGRLHDWLIHVCNVWWAPFLTPLFSASFRRLHVYIIDVISLFYTTGTLNMLRPKCPCNHTLLADGIGILIIEAKCWWFSTLETLINH